MCVCVCVFVFRGGMTEKHNNNKHPPPKKTKTKEVTVVCVSVVCVCRCFLESLKAKCTFAVLRTRRADVQMKYRQTSSVFPRLFLNRSCFADFFYFIIQDLQKETKNYCFPATKLSEKELCKLGNTGFCCTITGWEQKIERTSSGGGGGQRKKQPKTLLQSRRPSFSVSRSSQTSFHQTLCTAA